MDKFTRRLQAGMILMEGKELIYASSNNGTDKIKLCEDAIAYLQTCIDTMKKKPEDNVEEEGSKFQLTLELCKLNDNYFE